MGNRENYEISDEGYSFLRDTKKYESKVIYHRTIRHKYLANTFTEIKAFSPLELDEEIKKYINYHDKKYADEYNYDLKEIWSKISHSPIKKLNWKELENHKKIYWNRKSKFIKYNDVGMPICYLDDTKKEHTKKPKAFPFPFNKKDKIFIENKKHYEEYKNQEENWLTDYNKEVNRIRTNYYNYESKYIERYCNLVLMNSITFHARVKEILNNKNFNLSFNKENKSLNVEFILPSKNDAQYLLGDMIYHSNKDKYLKTWIHEKEIIKQLNHIWKQLIFIYSYALFINDEINAIDTIYFNAKLLDENQYKFELIIEKKSFYKKNSMNFNCKNIDDCIDGFRRDAVLLKRLRLEKLDPKIRKDSKSNIISLAIRNQKLSNKSIEYISSFKYLKELYLSENELKKIPRNILKLTQLKVLSITNNEIDNISFIDDLNRVDTLNLDNNLIEYIDEKLLKQLLEMPILKDISLNGNPIIDLIDEDVSYLKKDELISKLWAMPDRITSKKIKNKNIPLIITEGKTDWMHLENALKIFNARGEYKNLENKIEFFKYEKMGMGESRVSNRIEVESLIDRYLQEQNKRKLLHMFDRDTKYSKDYRDKEFVKPIDKEFKKFLEKELAIKYKTKSKIYKEIKEKLDKGFYSDIDEEFKSLLRGKDYLEWRRLSNSNVYVFCIPKINDELDEICIEFYYEQDEVKKAFDDGRRLFYGSEFDKDSVSYCKKYMTTKPYPKPLDILDGDKKKEVYLIDDEEKENIALSKNEFTQNILDGVEGFNNFDIENFRLIFDVIKRIVND